MIMDLLTNANDGIQTNADSLQAMRGCSFGFPGRGNVGKAKFLNPMFMLPNVPLI